MYSGSTESFGKQWSVGDVVGVFLDLIDKTISKYQVNWLLCGLRNIFIKKTTIYVYILVLFSTEKLSFYLPMSIFCSYFLPSVCFNFSLRCSVLLLLV